MAKRHTILPLVGVFLVATAGYAQAGVTVGFRPGFDPDPARRAEIERAASVRLREALDILREESDCRLDLAHDSLKVTVGYVHESDGIVPACYTFPDSTLRIVPEYVEAVDRRSADRIMSDFVRLEAPTTEILNGCTLSERAQAPDIVRNFLTSELMHEVYHDWQNRQARFPAVERGKTLLNHNRSAVGADWRAFLESHGVDMTQHDRQLAEAELQCCRVQIRYWRSRYGFDPAHPLARAFLHLMEAAESYYEGVRAR